MNREETVSCIFKKTMGRDIDALGYWLRVMDELRGDEQKFEEILRGTDEYFWKYVNARCQLVDLGKFKLWADPMDHAIGNCIITHKTYEGHVVVQIQKYMLPGKIFADFGANIGYYSIMAASRGCQVTAIEPNPMNHHLLYESIVSNGFENQVVVQPFAASDHSGYLRLYTNGSNGILNTGRATPNHHLVPLRRSGDLIPAHVDLMKVDVEGCELEVLKGAKAEIQRSRPVLFVEWFPALLKRTGGWGYPNQLLDWIIQHRYSINVIKHEGPVVECPTSSDVWSCWETYHNEGIQLDLICLPL